MKKIIVFLALLASLSNTGNAQYAIRLQEGKACELLTQSQLKIYLGKLDKLVKAGPAGRRQIRQVRCLSGYSHQLSPGGPECL